MSLIASRPLYSLFDSYSRDFWVEQAPTPFPALPEIALQLLSISKGQEGVQIYPILDTRLSLYCKPKKFYDYSYQRVSSRGRFS